jgi:general L-amino acid transport system substrate-binding protein
MKFKFKYLVISSVVVLCSLLASCSKELDYDTGLPFITLEGRGDTLKSIQKRGFLRCGVSTGIAGFSISNPEGDWTGLDADFCRAVAAATLGDDGLVKFIPLTTKGRFSALANHEIDLLARNTTWTMNRDLSIGLRVVGVNYYDGQSFMVRKNANIKEMSELKDKSICVQNATTSQLNLDDWFRREHMNYYPVVLDNADSALNAFQTGQCSVITSDQSQLYAHRLHLDNPALYEVLPIVISKEPLGPMVRSKDEQWFNIVKWTLNALVAAEELGINRANVNDYQKNSDHPEIRRLLGVEGGFGELLGLQPDWAVKVILLVGNYGEIYQRNVGENTPLNITRSQNKLWSDGGLMYSLPIR